MAHTGDASVTFEDQQCINRFATTNAYYKESKAELESKKSYLTALDDAYESVEEILLLDEDSKVPYQIGEVFFELSPSQVQDRLEQDKDLTKKRIHELESVVREHSSTLTDLKAKLYAKFGSKINLEEDPDD